jgi:signal transduction histidine kinase
VNAVTQDGYVIVSVRDHGVGIAKQDWELLFERFYRSEKTYNKFQGLGLGLFISSEIVKRHHGEIWVDSEPGKGSTFYFKLPLYQQTQEQESSGMKQAAGG